MIVGVLKVSLLLRESHSLKDKRRVVRSIKDRVRARTNAAIAEVDSQDLWQRADLGAVTVSGSRSRAETVLKDVLKIIDRAPAAERFDTSLEFF
ncbi:MAG: DUF503 domain-containing protein [Planctomycetota bacterium]|jgi:uncharacterized protein YlxP (DUF503 family)